MTASPTRFAWTLLGAPPYPPPEPRRGARFASSSTCWLCGDATDGVGWPRAVHLPDTFTNHNRAAAPTSDAVCQPCMYLASKESWEQFVHARPESGLKTGHAMSFRCYSHVFAADLHDSPTRARWRTWLLEPPTPPFLFAMALSGQKHILFRARVAYSRDQYPIQIEEDNLLVDRAIFAACLADAEAAYALGFSKDSIASGRYHHGQMLKVGLGAWRAVEARVAPWRTQRPAYLRLAAHVAQRPDSPQEE